MDSSPKKEDILKNLSIVFVYTMKSFAKKTKQNKKKTLIFQNIFVFRRRKIVMQFWDT